MGAARAPVFPLPFRRSDYLVRKAPSAWLADLRAGFACYPIGRAPEDCSALLNSFALLLLKLGDVARSRRLCVRQHRHFLAVGDPLAIQPFINLGRIDLRLGRFDAAGRHFFLHDRIRAGRGLWLGGAMVAIDPALADVCRTVRQVDGAQLVFARDGHEAARALLARRGRAGASAAAEMRIWFAFHAGEAARLEASVRRLGRSTRDPAKLAFYLGLAHARAGRERDLFLAACVLIEALRAAGDQRDHVASILHGLAFLLTLDAARAGPCARLHGQPAVRDAAAWLGDVELSAVFEGRDPRACYRVGADFAPRLDRCWDLAVGQLGAGRDGDRPTPALPLSTQACGA